MPRIWSNPEFIRHRRAELRHTRAITVGAVVLLLCVLIGLACWSSQQHQLLNLQQAAEQYGTDAYATALLDSLIAYVQSAACRPALELQLTREARAR